MGILFVLIVWMILFGILTLPLALILGYRARKNSTPAQSRMRRFLIAAALPFVLLAWGFFFFIFHVVFSETVLGTDPGIGDGWQVPVGNGYFFCMIDQTEHGYLLKGGCTGSPELYQITRIAQSGSEIVGISASQGAFKLDTQTDSIRTYRTQEEAMGSVAPSASLLTPGDFYGKRRKNWPAWIALMLFVLSSCWFVRVWYRRFISR